MNLIIQDRDKLIESPLLVLHVVLRLTLDSADKSGQLADALNSLGKVVSVLFLDLEYEFSESIVNLAVQVHAITHVLEIVIHKVEVAFLLHEFLHVRNGAGKVREGLAQPFLRDVSALTDDLGHGLLNLGYEVLRRREEGRPRALRINLKETNVSHRRQV